MSYQTYVRSDAATLAIAEVLARPPTVLLGVSEAAGALLHDLEIRTVFDLGMSTVFANATRLVAAGEQVDSEFRRFGRAPASMVDRSRLRSTEVTALPDQPIETLLGIGPGIGPDLMSALAVDKVRDLALWPPYLAAKAIVFQAYNPAIDDRADPEAPAELVPTSGTFATERFLHSSLVMFEGDYTNGPPAEELGGTRFDMTSTPVSGFQSYRFGAHLTYAQTWIPKHLARGQLLHSLPLAPGESTSVAVVDWSNKISAVTQESATESEKIESVGEQTRSVGQIASTVAREMQSGTSQSGSSSASAGGFVTGGALPFTVGLVSGGQNATASATHTVSTGERDIDSHLRQRIQDTTHQVSSAVRGQRAAVVTEVSQRESEHLSTRSITNYNHMHALTVQYYEVVQIYETQLRLHDVERCIYIPMKLVDFRDERNIFRYLSRLRAAALDEVTRTALDQLADSDQSNAMTFVTSRAPHELVEPRAPQAWIRELLEGLPFSEIAALPGKGQAVIESFRFGARTSARELENRGLLRLPTQEAPPHHLNLPFGLQLRSVSWAPDPGGTTPIEQVRVVFESGDVVRLTQNAPVALSFGAIQRIELGMRSDWRPSRINDFRVRLQLEVRQNNEVGWLDAGFVVAKPIRDYNGPYLQVTTPAGVEQAADLLMEHQLYYSQQVWMREDPQVLIMQLAPYRIELGSTLVTLVDHLHPVPIAVVGNYLVYRFAYDRDDAWKSWVKDKVDWSALQADEVPVPTGGVFAEAVLGRSNAAEKVDLTRFFNWQDSPPPAPPEIAALRAGTRTPGAAAALPTVEDAVLSVQAPLALPDPSGFTAMLSALTTAELFRNMSGATATADAGVAAAATSSAGSVQALTAAGETYTAMLSSIAKSLGSMTPEQGLKSLSEIGSLFNEQIKQAAKGAVEGLVSATAKKIRERLEEAGGRHLLSEDAGPIPSDDSVTQSGPRHEVTAPGVAPVPEVSRSVGETVTKPVIALLTAYLSQYENDSQVPLVARQRFGRGGVQGLGLRIRHEILERFVTTRNAIGLDEIYDLAMSVEEHDGVASLACHNVMRSFARGGTFTQMALPWERVACGIRNGQPETRWVTYDAGVPVGGALERYAYRFTQGSTAQELFLTTMSADKCPCALVGDGCPSGFYQLFDPDELAMQSTEPASAWRDPGDWYHYFITRTLTSYFARNNVELHPLEWASLLFDQDETLEARAYTLFIHVAVSAVQEMLRDYHQRHSPPNLIVDYAHVYDGWLWANATGILEEVGYGGAQSAETQHEVIRETRAHMRGAVDAIQHIHPALHAASPNWRWVVPTPHDLAPRVRHLSEQFAQRLASASYAAAAALIPELVTMVYQHVGPIEQYVHEVWLYGGASTSPPPLPVDRPRLVFGQHVPSSGEQAASGVYVGPILLGTPEHAALVTCPSPSLVHASGNVADYLMIPRLRDLLEQLAEDVALEWSDHILRITSAWRSGLNAATKSLHHEGRAVDLNVILNDPTVIAGGAHDHGKLGRLGQLAVEAGFHWVFYEPGHIHVSVRR